MVSTYHSSSLDRGTLGLETMTYTSSERREPNRAPSPEDASRHASHFDDRCLFISNSRVFAER